MVQRVLVVAIAAAVARTGAGQTTSSKCRTALNGMLEDENWRFMNNSFTRWCRMRAENEMARCCGLADFANGRGEGCSNCEADCIHAHFDNMCNSQFGKACYVLRKPFHREREGLHAKELIVKESFCVPENCNNNQDRDALMGWYGTLYVSLLDGWHADYDDATLVCPSAVGMVIFYVMLILILIAACIPVSIILFKAPKERGKTMISQEEMQAEADDGAGITEMADTVGTGGMQRLRNSAQGDSMQGQQQMAITGGSDGR